MPSGERSIKRRKASSDGTRGSGCAGGERNRKSNRLAAGCQAAALASNPAAVVRPVQYRLPLPAPALEIAGSTVVSNRGHVTHDRAPAPDLTGIVRRPAAHVVAAVPLKP